MDSSYPHQGTKGIQPHGLLQLFRSPIGTLKTSKEVIKILNAALSPWTLNLELWSSGHVWNDCKSTRISKLEKEGNPTSSFWQSCSTIRLLTPKHREQQPQTSLHKFNSIITKDCLHNPKRCFVLHLEYSHKTFQKLKKIKTNFIN